MSVHWRLEKDADQILWLIFDKKDASVNTLDREVLQEFSSILDDITMKPQYRGVVIASAKKSGFIAGADIKQFSQFKTIADAEVAMTEGQTIFNKLAFLPMPTVAMIDGFCLGGGLELALACTYRVVEESEETRLGLPEVKLSIYPGFGGTVRLPRLIGAPKGLWMIVAGKTLSGKLAAKWGLADVAVPRRQLVQAVKHYLLNQPPKHQPNPLLKLVDKKWIRPIAGHFMRKELRKKVNPVHYPAPFAVLSNWQLMGVTNDAAFKRESKIGAPLFFSETSHNLVRVFFLQERLKGLAKAGTTIKHVHVVGAGTMGGDIAAWCAERGFRVTLQDVTPQLIAQAIKRTSASDRLIGDVSGEGLATADLIIEAITEDLAAKQALFKQVEAKCKQGAILATNTSSIPLAEIATALTHPEQLVGLHFFNPVAKMLLVEVVQGTETSQMVVDEMMGFVRKLDKLPLPVKSSPGFLINRILMPYLLEAMRLLDEGVPMTTVDAAMTSFGMPMGPVLLADTVGLDVCLSVAKHLSQYYKVPISKRLSTLVEQKKWGKKTGEGFYQYDKLGHHIKPLTQRSKQSIKLPTTEEIAKRLVDSMVREARVCLTEGVVADADLLDAGMIFGAGFAPFRGGLMEYAKG